MSSEDACVLSGLTSLQTLYIRSWLPPPFSESLTASLSQLTRLTSLEIEAVSIPPEDSVMSNLLFLTQHTDLVVLRIKGLGLSTTQGLPCLLKLK
eukprot:CAMPEP_0202919184 /NCGR_PEP_ID=MMETSP1392-20130828/75243_1 /ASSEMBLY_ACC=CAM_ASM_000868 /TAXON_ID=225041 /ORGANISM="Chlamydomonas chlamydogama, Strain SAG 11-48b" /LENGTH=94 /DNA_ID=CAMNT_0049612455 /DNA_START=38 /DNA_END=319 /DNA_ORIENTATION=+